MNFSLLYIIVPVTLLLVYVVFLKVLFYKGLVEDEKYLSTYYGKCKCGCKDYAFKTVNVNYKIESEPMHRVISWAQITCTNCHTIVRCWGVEIDEESNEQNQ